MHLIRTQIQRYGAVKINIGILLHETYMNKWFWGTVEQG